MADNTRANLTKTSTWTRLIYIILFTITFRLAGLVIGMITLIQFFTVLLGGDAPNARLKSFGRKLAAYVSQVIAFLTYASDNKPFPIGEWPDNADENGGKNRSAKPTPPPGSPTKPYTKPYME